MRYLAECDECDASLGVPGPGDRIIHHADGSHAYLPDPEREGTGKVCAWCAKPLRYTLETWVHAGTGNLHCAGGEPYGETATPVDAAEEPTDAGGVS